MIPTEAEAFQDVSELARADVFICYARSDYQFVQRLEDALEKNGKSVSVNETDTVSSDEWQQISQPQSEASQNILVILSPDFVKSLYNRQELTYAVSLNKRLIPIVYREEFIAVPGRTRYTSIWEAIEINRLEHLTCTSHE